MVLISLTPLFRWKTQMRLRLPTMRPVTIVYAEQDAETIQIISARNAEKIEEQQYFKGDYHE